MKAVNPSETCVPIYQTKIPRGQLFAWLFGDAVRMIHDYGAIGGVKIHRGTEVFGENLPQYHFVRHKSHIT
jgi:hypothetical protein